MSHSTGAQVEPTGRPSLEYSMPHRRCPTGSHAGPLELRRKLDGIHAQQQCRACGGAVGKRIRIAMMDRDGRDLGRWLTTRPGEGRGNSKRREYEAFLRSPEWKAQRRRVLDRDGHACRNCGAPATSVHHLSYRPVIRDTKDEDLVASCTECNVGEREARVGGLLRTRQREAGA